jgi:hypothetical protein
MSKFTFLLCLSLGSILTVKASASLQWQPHQIDDGAGEQVVRYLGQQLNRDDSQVPINVSLAYVKLTNPHNEKAEPIVVSF